MPTCETFLSICFNMENLTQSEKAALYFQLVENCEDWKVIYKIAIGEKHYNKLKESTQNANTSHWKKSPRIQNAYDEIKRRFYYKTEEIKQKAIENHIEKGSEEPQKGAKRSFAKATNFLDRDEFLQFLNDRANEIQDDKLRNDILKMLSDNLRYKDTERDENNEIQRFYIPLCCKDCDLYKQKANEML